MFRRGDDLPEELKENTDVLDISALVPITFNNGKDRPLEFNGRRYALSQGIVYLVERGILRNLAIIKRPENLLGQIAGLDKIRDSDKYIERTNKMMDWFDRLGHQNDTVLYTIPNIPNRMKELARELLVYHNIKSYSRILEVGAAFAFGFTKIVTDSTDFRKAQKTVNDAYKMIHKNSNKEFEIIHLSEYVPRLYNL